MEDYNKKYLEYKIKYIQLKKSMEKKNQSGGALNQDIVNKFNTLERTHPQFITPSLREQYHRYREYAFLHYSAYKEQLESSLLLQLRAIEALIGGHAVAVSFPSVRGHAAANPETDTLDYKSLMAILKKDHPDLFVKSYNHIWLLRKAFQEQFDPVRAALALRQQWKEPRIDNEKRFEEYIINRSFPAIFQLLDFHDKKARKINDRFNGLKKIPGVGLVLELPALLDVVNNLARDITTAKELYNQIREEKKHSYTQTERNELKDELYPVIVRIQQGIDQLQLYAMINIEQVITAISNYADILKIFTDRIEPSQIFGGPQFSSSSLEGHPEGGQGVQQFPRNPEGGQGGQQFPRSP